ncbi:SH3 domain-containing C40 family peptidase [Clostridium sp. C2-6-12]|uniref:SH3 domain-containing C40 family peptidase n=1 Tax=Clostridium sp. C2-6-12 TaxID=2698832 RepID=UPI00136FD6E3|nr:SH3 domain-containing C40 family peptidase [Clostridium sp. C2-6-12]
MTYAIINKAIGELKRGPKENTESMDEVLFGMIVEILNEEKDNWFYVRTHYKYEGYINGDNLIIDDEIGKLWESEKNAVIINSFADILNKPQVSSYKIASLTRGGILISTGQMSKDGRFIKVKLPNLKAGWVKKSFISKLILKYDIKDERNLRENLAKAALSYLGTQYRWGGKTPLGIDCSGLCSMAYMLNGVLIYRDAEIKEGFPIKEIPFENIKKGDLIFFPGHVAMYLENGNYIHSSTNNDLVKINNLNKNVNNYDKYLSQAPKRFGSIF